MRLILSILFICICYGLATADEPFIKTVDDPFQRPRFMIEATPDSGWVVFSQDSVKLYKFDRCGNLQWVKKYNYDFPPNHWNSNYFSTIRSGGFIFMTKIKVNTSNTCNSLITKLDANGNVIWSKVIGDFFYSHDPYNILEDNNGDFILRGNVEKVPSDNKWPNLLCKISSTGNVLWAKLYDSFWYTWGFATITSDNGILARSGRTFFKTDNSGNIEWVFDYNATPYSVGYFAPVEVDDGFIFNTYNHIGTHYLSFHKIDKQGNIIGNYKQSNLTGIPRILNKNNNGNILCALNDAILEFDKDLNIINYITIASVDSLNCNDICITSDGYPVVTGIMDNKLFVAKSNQQFSFSCGNVSLNVTFTNQINSQTFITANPVDYLMPSQNYNLQVETLNLTQNSVCKLIKSIDIGKDTILCAATNFILGNKSDDSFDNYLWSTGETTPTIIVTEPGVYWLRVDYNCGEDVLTDTIEIKFHPAIEVNIGEDILECDSVTAVLIAPLCTGCDYSWSTGNTNSIITVKQPGDYWLTVKDSIGCIYSDTINVDIVKCECHVYVPSAFTPNNDGKNEIFNPVFYCDMDVYQLTIFNRWGELIYNSDNNLSGWNGKINGKPVATGVYIYRMEYVPLLKNKQQQTMIKMGMVSVVY